VERKNPVVRSAFGGEILLVGVVGPLASKKFGAVLEGDFFGAVAAAGIDDDDFIGNADQGSESAGQVFFLVEGDEAGGDASHVDGACDVESVSHKRRGENVTREPWNWLRRCR